MDRRNAGGDLHFLHLAPWRMTVNNRGLTPAALTDPGSATQMFNLRQTTDTNGLIHEMKYDAKGNMLSKTADPGGFNHTMYWSYESNCYEPKWDYKICRK